MARKTKREKLEKELANKAQVIDDQTYFKALKIQHESSIKKEVAELERLKKEKLQGTLIPLADVETEFLQISSQVRTQLYRLVSQLPPKLEGLTITAMTGIVKESVEEILQFLSNSFKCSEPNIDEALETQAENDEEDIEESE